MFRHRFSLLLSPNQTAVQTSPIGRRIFSFSGAGWMFLFHLGAVKALQEHPQILEKATFCGSSGGALASACAALNVNTDKLADHVIQMSEKARKNKIGLLQLRPLVVDGIDIILDDVGFSNDKKKSESEKTPEDKAQQKKTWEEKVQSKLRGRCQVYMTGLPEFSAIVEQEFATKEILVESLVASCCIPPFAGFPFVNSKGKLVADGGFREVQPRRKEPFVITVCPFVIMPFKVDVTPNSGLRIVDDDEHDDCSKKQQSESNNSRKNKLAIREAIPVKWALFPPDASTMRAVYRAGYDEMKRYLEHNKIGSEEQKTIKHDQNGNGDGSASKELLGKLLSMSSYMLKLFVINAAVSAYSVYSYFK